MHMRCVGFGLAHGLILNGLVLSMIAWRYMETYDNKLLGFAWVLFYWIPLALCRKNLDRHLRSPILISVMVGIGFLILLTAWRSGLLYFAVSGFVILSPVYLLAIKTMERIDATTRERSMNCGSCG